jgi:hypothetical protein
MPVEAPPRGAEQEELEALIEEARRRARRRRLGYAVVLMVVFAVGGGLYALLGNGGIGSSPAPGRTPLAGTSHGANARTCRSGQASLRMGTTQGATGALVNSVGAELRHGPECTLMGTLHYSVRHADGSLVRRIDGNPATFAVHSVIRNGPLRKITPTWGWSNWCHGEGRFEFRATVDSMKTSAPVAATSCEGRPGSSQSVLYVLPGSRAALKRDWSR